MFKVREESLQHLEIAEYLIKNIRSGTFGVNEKIPSENELCRQFQVNRHTVRQAIARMTNLGWVTPLQGKGCYVNSLTRPIQYVLSSKTRFSENMENNGLKHKSKLLDWKKERPTEEERVNLELSEDEMVYRLEILRYVDEKPISITTTVMPDKEVPFLEAYLNEFKSLYSILLEHYQFRPIRFRSTFQASLPMLRDSELLEIPESIPIVQIESVMNHPSGSPIEYSVARIRGDMHKCLVEF
ncbi:GntR family transcriptional regulator [Metabacillus herbersteinensis]|uniref:GntR family transcriptional regulator n=1 Tax=Metabacillus herbersteinensis TaxID=283816 RepID=A0ABV6GBJ3_9BACI